MLIMLLKISTCHQRELCVEETGIAVKLLKRRAGTDTVGKVGLSYKIGQKRSQNLTDTEENGTIHVINHSSYIEEFP